MSRVAPLFVVLLVMMGLPIQPAGRAPVASAAAGDGLAVALVGPSTIGVGVPTSYQLTVTNVDVSSAQNLSLDLYTGGFPPIPLAVTGSGGWTCRAVYLGYSNCTLATLASGVTTPTLTFTLTPTGQEGEDTSVEAFVAADSLGAGYQFISLTVTAPVDVTVSGTRPRGLSVGQAYSVPFVVSERGTSGQPAVGPVSVDFGPFFYDPATSTSGSGGVTVVGGAGWTCVALQCDHPGPVPAGGSLPAITAGGTYQLAGEISATVDVGSDGLSFNNSVAVPIEPDGADLAVAVYIPTNAVAGAQSTMSVLVYNTAKDPHTGPATVVLTTTMEAPSTSSFGWTCGSFTAGSATCTSSDPTESSLSVTGTIPFAATQVTGGSTVSPGGWRSTNDTQSLTRTVLPSWNLAIALAAATPTFTAGSALGYTVTVSNTSQTLAPGPVTITGNGTLGAVVGTDWSCTVGIGTFSCTNPNSVPAGTALPVLNWTGTVFSGQTGSLTASASRQGPQDANPLDDSRIVSTPVAPPNFDLAVALAGPASYPSGGPATLTATVSNPGVGESPAPVTLLISSGLIGQAASGSGWSCSNSFGTLTCTSAAAVGVGASLPVVTVTGTAPTFGTQVGASASVSPGGATTPNDSTTRSTPLAPPDLAVVVSDGGATFVQGDEGEYRISVQNVGAGDAAGTVTVGLTSPLTGSSAAGTGWICVGTFGLTCTREGPVAAGATLPDIVVTGIAPDRYDGLLTLYANVSSGNFTDNNFTNNSDSEPTPVTPLVDFAVTAEVQGSLTVGEPGSILVTVTNLGAGSSGEQLDLYLDAAPFGADGSVTAAGWSCTTYFSGSAWCTRSGPVGPGATLTLVWAGTVRPVYQAQAEIRFDVSNAEDIRYANDAVAIRPTVVSPVDLTVLVNGPPALVAGEDATFTVSVANVGTAPSVGEVSVDSWAQFDGEIVSLAGDQWDCFFSSCLFSGTIPAGGSALPLTMTLTARSTYNGIAITQVAVSGGGDGLSANNVVEVATPMPPTADAVISIDDGGGPFIVGRRAEVSVVVSDPGTLPVAGPVQAFVSLSYNVTEVEATGDGWTCTVGFSSVDCEHAGPIPAGGALAPITVSGLVGNVFATRMTTSASVSAADDQRTDNNSASIQTLVGGESDLTIAVAGGAAVFGLPASVTATVTNTLATEAVGEISAIVSVFGLTAPTATGTGWVCGSAVGSSITCTTPGPLALSASAPAITVTGVVARTSDASLFVSAEVRGATDGNRTNDFTNDEVAVITPVDLSVTVSDGGATFVAGGTGSSTVTVVNAGSDATDSPAIVTITTFPATATAGSGAGWTCVPALTVLTCTTHEVIAGGANAAPITVDVPVPTNATFITTRAVVANAQDGRSGNDTGTDGTQIVAVTDLTVAVGDGGVSFTAGGTGTYSVIVTNEGTAASSGEITVAFGASGPISLLSAAGAGWTCAGAGASCATTAVVAPGAALPSITVTVEAGSIAAGAQANLSANVSGGGDTATFNDFGGDSTPVVSPDLVVAVSDGDATFTAPGTGSYTVTVGNRGGAATVGATTVSLSVGGPMSIEAASGAGWSCPTATTCTSSALVAVGGDFPAITVAVALTASAVRSVSLTAAASGVDSIVLNSTATETTPTVVPADVTVTLTAVGPWLVQRASTMTATVANVGTGASVGPVTVTFDGPVTAAGTGWSCTTGVDSTTCTRPDGIAAGVSLPDITATELPALSAVPQTTRSVTVVDPGDGTPANNTSTIDIPVAIAVDLSVAVATVGPFAVGQPGSATITVTNLGVETAPGPITVLINQDPNRLPVVEGDGWDCLTLFQQTVCITSSSIAAGGSLPPIVSNFNVILGDYPTTALSVNLPDTGDPTPSNDYANAAVTTNGVDLEVVLTDLGTGAAQIGDTRSFTIDVTNVGGLAPPGAATVTVDPGPGLLQGSFTGAGWSCTPDGTNFTCSTTATVPPTGAYAPLTFAAYIGGDAFPDSYVEVSVVAPAESRIDSSNAARVGFDVIGAADVVVDVAAPVAIDVDDTLAFAATVRNRGQLAIDGVTTVDFVIPPGAISPLGEGQDWICGSADDHEVVRCQSTAVVDAGATFPAINFSLTVGLAAYPQMYLLVLVDNANDDGDIFNNVTRPLVRVAGIPDLQPTNSLTELVAGGTSTATITVRNVGTETATAPSTITFDALLSDAGIIPTGASGPGWSCAGTGVALSCTNTAEVAAAGELPALTVSLAVDAVRYDAGTTCRPIEYGARLLRGCQNVGIAGVIPVMFRVANASDPRNPAQSVGNGSPVHQPVDLLASSVTDELYPGAVATITTRVFNVGVMAAAGPVTLVQRVECGLAADLAAGAQANCLAGTDALAGYTALDVAGAGWNCALADGVATCTHPGPVASGAELPPVVAHVAIGNEMRGANLWVAPSVRNASDTNPSNDQPEDGRVIRLRPPEQPDLSLWLSPGNFTVGINGVIPVSVVNAGSVAMAGPTTVTVDLGAGFAYLAVQGGNWACTPAGAVVTCSTSATLPAGQLASFSLVVAPLAAGVPHQAISATIDNAADTVDSNDRRSVLHKVFANPAPVAIAGVDRSVAKVNQTRRFDASFSENTFAITTFRWDFGDGVTAFGEVVDHIYERPGTYNAVLTVANGPQTSRATVRIIVVPDEPLVADAGDDRVGEEQLPISFDGGASRPFAAIESFTWDFGDGTPVVLGRTVQHIYAVPGEYTATLTITSGLEADSATVVVVVGAQGSGGANGGLQVTVTDNAGNPVRAADVSVLDAAGVRYSARTNDAGVASLRQLPDGRFSVYAYKLGYQPVVGRARVVGGLGVAAVTLTPGQVGTASLEHRRLTLDEIIAAGIDVNDPANQNIVEFEIQLGFSVDPTFPADFGFGGLLNGDGEFIQIPLDWDCSDTRTECTYDNGDTQITVEVEEIDDAPVLVFLIIPVKASFLKEFFEVSMVVANLAPKGFAFTKGAATVDLPAGLTLAPTATVQDLTIDMVDIPSGKTGVARWIVRGDRPGSYQFGVAYTGVIDPVGSPVLLQASTKVPLKVWGVDAMNVRVRAQQQVRKGKPYLVRVGIENISDGPIYNLALELGPLAGDANFEYAPWTDRTPGTDVIDPQTTTWFDIWMIPGFNGELVSCNLCARRTPTGRTNALLAATSAFDTGDVTSFIDGLAAGQGIAPDPTATEIVSVPDDNLSFTATSSDAGHQLAWTPVAGADGYEVFVPGSGAPVAALPDGATGVLLPAGSATSYVLATLFSEDRQLRHPQAVVAAVQPPPPVVVADNLVAIVGEPLTTDVLGNDVDPTGGELAIVGVVQPAHGTVLCLADGTCTYTPDDGFIGEDAFEVIVEGANGVQTSQIVTVTVAPPGSNRPPTAIADSASVEAGQQVEVAVLLNDTDADSDDVEVVSHGAAAHGTVTCTIAACQYVAAADFVGLDSFIYTVSDGVATASAAVLVAVAAPPTTTTTTTTTSTTSTTSTTVPGTTTSTTTTTGPGTTTTTGPPASTTTTSTTVPPTTTTTSTTVPTTTTTATVPPTSTTVPPTTTSTSSTTTTSTTTSPSTSTTVSTTSTTLVTPPTGLPPVPPVPPAFTARIPVSFGTLVPGRTVTVPLPPRTQAYRLVLYSTPVVLDEGGPAVAAVATIPNDVRGSHTLVLWAVVDDQVIVQGLPVTVGLSPGSFELPSTGSDPWSQVQFALLMLGLGLRLVIARRRRVR